MNFVEEFRAAMHAHGLTCHGEIVVDGKVHRFKTDGDDAANSWYCLFPPNPIPAGAYGCWKRGFKENWHQKNGERPQGKELAAMQRQWKQIEEQRAAEEKERHKRMALAASAFIAKCGPADQTHLYLTTKQVGVHNLLSHEEMLVLPLRDVNGDIWSYQTIDAIGDKLFMPGGRVEGTYFELAAGEGPIAICEGYATGASIHEATGWPTICAINCGNLMAVARTIRDKHPKRLIVICADDDRFTRVQGVPKNPGMEKGLAAAKQVSGTLVAPIFPPDATGTDFNDLSVLRGTSEVARQLLAAVSVGMGDRMTISRMLDFVPKDDPDCVIGDRFLCRGDSCVIVGQTHVGKSSIGMQIAVLLAMGASFFGIKSRPSRVLKSLIIQAENNIGDMAEMFQGVLLGSGLLRPGDDEHNREVARTLEQNLIIVRDQTRVGMDFCAYSRKLIEIHRPDLIWLDPMLSFYGSDINDQQAMSSFLRQGLNPISEQTGVIWMVLHHTGKPMRDAAKTTKSWNTSDFAYMGLGSSELSNWARAIISIVRADEDEFRVVLAKRGWRAGAVDEHEHPTNELYLAHSSNNIYWKRIPKPDNKRTEENLVVFSREITTPMSATDIVELAAKKLERGKRTVWKLWDSGGGPLGSLFVRESGSNKYVRRDSPGASPYRDD